MSGIFIEPPIPPLSEPVPTVAVPPVWVPPAEQTPASLRPYIRTTPESEQSSSDLGDLGALLVFFVALGLLAVAVALRDFLNWFSRFSLGRLWRQGGGDIQKTSDLLQPLSSALGKVELGVDAQVAGNFHGLAGTVTRVGQAISAAAELGYKLAGKVNGLEATASSAAGAAALAASEALGASAAAKTAQTTAATVGTRSAAATAALGHAQASTTEHITHLIEPELDALRGGLHELELGSVSIWDLLRKHEEALSIAGVTTATAAALGRLGGGWIRCDSTRMLGEAVCGSSSSEWRKLLEGAIPLLAVADLCFVLREISAVASSGPVQEALDVLTTGVEDLLVCVGATVAEPLPVARFTPGPLTAWGAPGAA